MPQYLSPGVYVEEVPSAVQAIAGVGTSTAGFIGIAPKEIIVPLHAVTQDCYITEPLGTKGNQGYPLRYPVNTDPDTCQLSEKGHTPTLVNDHKNHASYLTLDSDPADATAVKVSYQRLATTVFDETVPGADGSRTRFALANHPVVPSTNASKVTVNGGPAANGATVKIDNDDSSAYVDISPAPAKGALVKVTYDRMLAAFIRREVTVESEQLVGVDGKRKRFTLANNPVKSSTATGAVRRRRRSQNTNGQDDHHRQRRAGRLCRTRGRRRQRQRGSPA